MNRGEQKMQEKSKSEIIKELCSAAYLADLGTCEKLVNENTDIINEASAFDMLSKDPLGNMLEGKALTPLMCAVIGKNSTDIVRLLLKKGAQVNKQSDDGWTALHFLIRVCARFPQNSYSNYQLLMSHKANTDLLSKAGKSAFEMDDYNSSVVPTAYATKDVYQTLFPHVNPEKCFTTPESIVKYRQQKTIQNDDLQDFWWNDLYRRLIGKNRHIQISSKVGGCRVHFCQSIPEEEKLSEYLDDYIFIKENESEILMYVNNQSGKIQCSRIKLEKNHFKHVTNEFKGEWVALTFADIHELIEKCSVDHRHSAMNRDGGLITNLKCIYQELLKSTSIIEDSKFSQDDKKNAQINRDALLYELKEGISHCEQGFKTRVYNTVAMLFRPKNFDEMIYCIKEQAMQEIYMHEFDNEVHQSARMSRIASVCFGILPLNDNERIPSDQHEKKQSLIHLLLNKFSDLFRIYGLTVRIIEMFKDAIRRHGYQGVKLEGYTSSESYDFVKEISNYLNLDFDPYDQSLKKHDGLSCYDLNWHQVENLVRIKLFDDQYFYRNKYQSIKKIGDIELLVCSEGDALDFFRHQVLSFNEYKAFVDAYGANAEFHKKLLYIAIENDQKERCVFHLTKMGAHHLGYGYASLYQITAQDAAVQAVKVKYDRYSFYDLKTAQLPNNNATAQSVKKYKPNTVQYDHYKDKKTWQLAMMLDSLDVFWLLFAHDSDINHFCDENWSPLHQLAFFGAQILQRLGENNVKAIFAKLALHKMDFNYIPKRLKLTPLMVAIEKGNLLIIQLLVHHGANLGLVVESGWSPLHHLAYYSRNLSVVSERITELFLQHKVDMLVMTEDGQSIIDVAASKTYKQKLLQYRVQQAIKDGDTTAVSEICSKHKDFDINQGAKLIQVKSQPVPKEPIINHQNEDTSTTLEELTQKYDHKMLMIDSTVSHLFETRLLSNDICVSGFNSSKKIPLSQKLVIALLQCVYEEFPQYQFGTDQPENIPELWLDLSHKILKKCNVQHDSELNDDVISKLVEAVNEEFKHDGDRLSFAFYYTNGVFSSPESSAVLPKYSLVQYIDQVFIKLPSKTFYAPKEQDAKLLQLLCLQGAMIKNCCLEDIHYRLGKSLKEASVKSLQNHLESATAQLSSLKTFAAVYNLFAEVETQNKTFLTALGVLYKLRKCENENWLESFKRSYLSNLNAIILKEFTKRKTKIDQVDEDNKLLKLEMQIQSKKLELEELLKKLADRESIIQKKQFDLEESLKKANIVKLTFEKQAKVIESKIAELKISYEEKSKSVIDLTKVKNIDSQALEKTKQDKEDIAAEMKALEAEKTQLMNKLNLIDNHLNNLSTKKSTIDLEKQKLDNEKKVLDMQRSRHEDEIKSIRYLNQFVANVEAAFKASETLFLNRKDIKFKLNQIVRSANSLKALYDYLINDLKLNNLIDKDFDQYANNAGIYGTYCFQAIWEIIADAKLSYDEKQSTLTIKGYNLDWDDCVEKMREFITDNLSLFGFVLENGHLKLKYGTPKIAALPNALAKLLIERISVKCSPEKYAQPDDDPQWSECKDRLNAELIDKLDIEYLDLFSAYFASVSLISGNDTFINSDQVNLPSVNFSIWAQRNIFFKPNCQLNTSSPPAQEFLSDKARNGSAYQDSSGRGTGRDGDHGLCGLAGKSAGHITLKAKQNIINLLTLKCEAHGGRGAKGQIAGDGDQGIPGKDTPDAVPDTPGKRNWYILDESDGTCFAIAHTPGIRGNRIIPDEISGDGGNAGKAGLGGEGGHGGDVIIEDQQHTARLIAGEEPLVNEYMLEYVKTQISVKTGQAGEDGAWGQIEGAACGGDAGEAGYHGFPVAITKKVIKKLLVFKKREVNTHRNDFDISQIIQIMRSRGAGEYGESANYKHQLTCGSLCPLPLSQNPKLRQSTHAVSRGKDKRHERSARLSETKRNKALKITNIHCNTQHKQQLHSEATLLSKLTIVEEANQVTQNKQAALDQEVGKVNDSLNICANNLAQKQQLLQAVDTEITEQQEQKASMQALVDKINNDIQKADEAAKNVLLDLLDHIEKTVQSNHVLSQAKISLKCSKVDLETESSILSKLTSKYNMISSLLQMQQNKIMSEIENEKMLESELKNLETNLKNDIKSLLIEHENLVKAISATALEKEELDLAIHALSTETKSHEAKLVNKIETHVQVEAPPILQTSNNACSFFHKPASAESDVNDEMDLFDQLEEILGGKYE